MCVPFSRMKWSLIFQTFFLFKTLKKLLVSLPRVLSVLGKKRTFFFSKKNFRVYTFEINFFPFISVAWCKTRILVKETNLLMDARPCTFYSVYRSYSSPKKNSQVMFIGSKKIWTLLYFFSVYLLIEKEKFDTRNDSYVL